MVVSLGVLRLLMDAREGRRHAAGQAQAVEGCRGRPRGEKGGEAAEATGGQSGERGGGRGGCPFCGRQGT